MIFAFPEELIDVDIDTSFVVEYIYLGKVTVERSSLKHFLEAAESLQIKGLSSCSSLSRPPANSSCHPAAVPTDLSTNSRDRAAAAKKQLPQQPRGDVSEQQGSRSTEKNSRTAAAAVENSRTDAEQSSRTAGEGQSAVAPESVSGGPRTDPVQMVRIVKKRSALGATSPRAAKRPKRPQSRQSTGTGAESAEQNPSGKYCTVPVLYLYLVLTTHFRVADPHSFHPDPDPDPAFLGRIVIRIRIQSGSKDLMTKNYKKNYS